MTDLSTRLGAIFAAHKHDFQRCVNTLQQAVAAVAAGTLDEALRLAAERDAHRLSGSLGTFGLSRASQLARELEASFSPSHSRVIDDAPHLSDCVTMLHAALDGEQRTPPSAQKPYSHAISLRDVSFDPDPSELEADERRLRWSVLECGLGDAEAIQMACERVLVVDDDAAVRDVLVAMLVEAGYDARGVGSAREARHALAHETISLLFTDVSMPGETGLDLIRFALCEHPETATLLISALEDPGIAQVALDYGAYGYLDKPVRRSAVLIGVMNALRRREIEARERAARSDLQENLRLRTSALTDALQRLEGAAAQRRAMQAETVHRWAQSAEHHDHGIGRHLKRVGHYCAMLGKSFGLHAESLELASVLHDVGKASIPDRILLKAGPLTLDERLAIQTHAMVGYEMLRGSGNELLDLAALIAKTHHEKFDGSGYPYGLVGTDIPLEGRIAAVADIFDALTDRAYRQAWSLENALEWMGGQRGKHFDPDVLDAFLASLDEVRCVRPLLS